MRAVRKNGIGLKCIGPTHSGNTHSFPKHCGVPKCDKHSEGHSPGLWKIQRYGEYRLANFEQ